MAAIGNFIWVITAGWLLALGWLLAAAVAAISIILLPFAPAALRLAWFALLPFGRELVDKRILEGGSTATDKTARAGLNIVWLVIIGWWLAIYMTLWGLLLCVIVIGIPFGIQAFKLAGAALWPVGREVVPKALAREAQTLSAQEQLAARRARRAG